MKAPAQNTINRDDKNEKNIEDYSRPLLRVTSSVCDCVGICCAVPLIIFNPCVYACTGIFSFVDYKPPPKNEKRGILDKWYRGSIFSLHGGSLLQLHATQCAYWSFPLIKQHTDYALHKVEVSPSNICGEYCFVPIVNAAEPQFRIKKTQSGVYSVRLNSRFCGSPITEFNSSILNDVWRINSTGEIITSVKTRGFRECCSYNDGTVKDYFTYIPVSGPAMFVAVNPNGPTIQDVQEALETKH